MDISLIIYTDCDKSHFCVNDDEITNSRQATQAAYVYYVTVLYCVWKM